MVLDSYLFTHPGGRPENQDAIGARQDPPWSVYVVADGLGGHAHGELASKCVVDTLLSAPPLQSADLDQWLAQHLEQCNANVLSLQEQSKSNMKSTVAVLTIHEQKAAWANVGDSRVYHFHNQALVTVTEDHSVAYKKYKHGEIPRAQIGTDADQSSLLRSLGSPQRHQPDCHRLERPVEEGDGFLLCSDGLWEYLLDEEILVDFLKADSARAWGQQLLLRAMERIRPGNDNLSLITVMVKA